MSWLWFDRFKRLFQGLYATGRKMQHIEYLPLEI